MYYDAVKPGTFHTTPSDIKNSASVILHGPFAHTVVDDSLDGINPCTMYNVLLQADLSPGKYYVTSALICYFR